MGGSPSDLVTTLSYLVSIGLVQVKIQYMWRYGLEPFKASRHSANSGDHSIVVVAMCF